MRKEMIAIFGSIALVAAIGACKKKEEAPPVPQTMPGPVTPQGQQQMPPGHGMGPQGETVVVVPDSVKGKWSGVVLSVEDKATKKVSEYTVNLNSDLSIPNTNLKITVGDFLPDFRMEGLNLTSVSNDPKNPAVAVKVIEGDQQVFPAPGKKWGWLYSKPELRQIHPFEHQKYGIMLKNGVKKG